MNLLFILVPLALCVRLTATQETVVPSCLGKWVQWSPPLHPAHNTTLACPFAVESHPGRCSANRTARVSWPQRRFELDNVPGQSGGCRAFDPPAFLRTMAHRRLALVGDSVLMQVWQALVCDLYASLPSSNASSLVRVSSQADGHKEVLFLEHNVTVISSRWDWWYKRGSAAALLSSFGGSDAVVMNFGLHYNEYDGKPARDADMIDYAVALQALSADIASMQRPHWRLFFAETTPQHFDGHSSGNGYFNLHRGRSCRPLNASQAVLHDWRNDMLRNRTLSMLPANVLLVPLPALASQWDAHREMDEGPGQGVAAHHLPDCTHWCLPSTALRYICSALFSAVA